MLKRDSKHKNNRQRQRTLRRQRATERTDVSKNGMNGKTEMQNQPHMHTCKRLEVVFQFKCNEKEREKENVSMYGSAMAQIPAHTYTSRTTHINRNVLIRRGNDG